MEFGMLQFQRFLYNHILWSILYTLILPYAMLGTLMCESFLVQLIIREHLQASDRRERCSPCLQKRGRDLRDIVIQTSFHPVLLCSSLHLIFTFRGSLWYEFPNFFASIFMWVIQKHVFLTQIIFFRKEASIPPTLKYKKSFDVKHRNNWPILHCRNFLLIKSDWC